MRLADSSASHATRVLAACTGACVEARAHAFLAWNVDADAWYGPGELRRIQAALDGPRAGLAGAALLGAVVPMLKWLRSMTVDEADDLPDVGINHRVWASLSGRYDFAPSAAMVVGALPGEPPCEPLPGTRFELLPRLLRRAGAPVPVRIPTWLTFDSATERVPRDPDQVSQKLGLPTQPTEGPLIRVEIDLAALRAGGGAFALPTLFDAIWPPDSPNADWRARPQAEHRAQEPWGLARDFLSGGPALPEILAELDPTTVLQAESLGPTRRDWSARPYLAGAPQ